MIDVLALLIPRQGILLMLMGKVGALTPKECIAKQKSELKLADIGTSCRALE